MSGRNARAGLPFLFQDQPDRVQRDRLEILTTLIAGPSFDPIFRPDVIEAIANRAYSLFELHR